MISFTRRGALLGAASLAIAPKLIGTPGLIGSAHAATPAGPRHGMSLFGDLKYGADFAHLDYVNPDAPRGGRLVMVPSQAYYNQSFLTFNTLSSFVIRGDAPPLMEFTFDSLMKWASDEPDACYGLVAESVEVSDDGLTLHFRLRPEARFNDGTPLVADDVVYSMNILKEKGHPDLLLPLKEMVSVEADGEHDVVVTLSGKHSPELKLVIAQLPIFSRAWYQGREFDASTLDAPLGSGPYEVGELQQGRFIEYRRVEDYWAKDLPINRGFHNFDVMRLEFFRDRQAGFEAFKKGAVTFREEFSSKSWATEYDFPAVVSGKVATELMPDERLPDFQAWYFNTRRGKFADPATRQAIGLAFDFEWLNTNLFYDSYRRTASWFEKSVYAAEGEPSEAELALLEPFRDELPEEVFGPAVVPPTSDGSGVDRDNLRKADELLRQAGWSRNGGQLINNQGDVLSVEFLIQNDPVSERVLGKFVDSLRRLGVDASIRPVDSAQYQARASEFNFDVLGLRLRSTPTPLESLRASYGSASADLPGSRNYAGIHLKAVDALIDQALAANDRDTHRNILRALDRILRAHYFVVPQWYQDAHRVARWDMFSRPETKPDYNFPFETTWWYDEEKAKRIGVAG
ncbi:extracellular solute-binding protein [Afifella aestuarii]|uniref:extracellular solute-binding protein n=1 Tax=Afifella aestuarii TaxID=1909496 RepID=UPI00196B07B7|nr:extracellular solute-binding protein [Afifella aestuarii]